MNPIKESGPKTLPDFVKEHDVFGQIKSKRNSTTQRVNYKKTPPPDLKVLYAGLGIRTLATLIDLIIVLAVLLIPEIFFFSFNFSDLNLNIYRAIIVFNFGMLYHVAFESSASKATPGKMLLKLKIIDLYGKDISVARALLRCLSALILVVPFGLGAWHISTDQKKRSWHDLIAGTYVIKS